MTPEQRIGGGDRLGALRERGGPTVRFGAGATGVTGTRNPKQAAIVCRPPACSGMSCSASTSLVAGAATLAMVRRMPTSTGEPAASG